MTVGPILFAGTGLDGRQLHAFVRLTTLCNLCLFSPFGFMSYRMNGE